MKNFYSPADDDHWKHVCHLALKRIAHLHWILHRVSHGTFSVHSDSERPFFRSQMLLPNMEAIRRQVMAIFPNQLGPWKTLRLCLKLYSGTAEVYKCARFFGSVQCRQIWNPGFKNILSKHLCSFDGIDRSLRWPIFQNDGEVVSNQAEKKSNRQNGRNHPIPYLWIERQIVSNCHS